MEMIQLVRKFGRVDLKLIWRDRFLLMMFALVVVLALALRYAMPGLDAHLAETGVLPSENISLRLADVFPMIVAYMAIFQGGMLVGVIMGFMLLDEKDYNTIKAMLVTPVTLNQYVLYRVGLPAVLGIVVILAMTLLINQALIPLWQLTLIAAAASITAPCSSLFLGIFAENKVQGFAVSKFISLAGYIIVFGWFVSEPFQWLFGLFPPFLVAKAYWMALEGHALWWLVLLIGTFLQFVMLAWFVRRFNREAYR